MVLDGVLAPMELGHLPYLRHTFETYVGTGGLERLGKHHWRKHVEDVIARLKDALQPDYVVLGGGNVKKLKTLPPGTRRGSNKFAFRGGFRVWE
jgi:polyphosphate glucokinase